jgi:AraC-like DNA-binding protein
LTTQQIKNSSVRIGARNQIKLLNLVADALKDEYLGVRLAQAYDLRELGLLYYVPASSDTFSEALKRVARYSTIHNDGVCITYCESKDISIKFDYVGVARLYDRHQIEFFVTTLIRLYRQLTGRHLSPSRIRLKHRRDEFSSEFTAFLGCDVAFGHDVDEITYSKSAACSPLVSADPYLSALLLTYCDEILSSRGVISSPWKLKVENACVPLLPHGHAQVIRICEQLGVSRRTLARRLADENITFAKLLDNLRFKLAKRYLREPHLPISEIAWLLGYREISSFNHAFKRWTGKNPGQARA